MGARVAHKAMKAKLFEYQGGACCYCGRAVRLAPPPWPTGTAAPDDFATLEHLQRRAEGGTHHPDNLALACFLCNCTRGARSWVEFKTIMSKAA